MWINATNIYVLRLLLPLASPTTITSVAISPAAAILVSFASPLPCKP